MEQLAREIAASEGIPLADARRLAARDWFLVQTALHPIPWFDIGCAMVLGLLLVVMVR